MHNHIVMLVTNAYRPDPRVQREANTLSQQKWKIDIIAWDRLAELPEIEFAQGVNIHRIQNIQSRYGMGIKQLLFIPQFWKSAIHKTIKIQPGVIHCHDLDTLYAGFRIKKQLNCKLVFDSHEDYPAQMSLYLPRPFIWLLHLMEKSLVKHADAILTASSVLAEKYRKQGLTNVLWLPNVCEFEPYQAVSKADALSQRQKLGVPDDELLVAYIGGFTKNRLLLPVIKAVQSVDNTHLYLWGDGVQREVVEEAIKNTSNVHYGGWLPAHKLPLYLHAVDVIYYCLKPDYPGALFNAPNTLSYAMAAGKPLIANNVGDLGIMIRSEKCGILLNETTPETICQAIKDMQNSEFREMLGKAGKRAAEKHYNWGKVSENLSRLYSTL